MRRRPHAGWTIAACCLWGAGALPVARAQGPQPRLLLTEREGFMLLPPELVVAPVVEQVRLSPDGRYALVRRRSARLTPQSLHDPIALRSEPPGETALVLWDSVRREGKELWKAATPAASIERMEWLPGSTVALALVRRRQGAEMREGLLRVDAAAGRAAMVGQTELSDFGLLELSISPSQPLAVALYTLRPPDTGAGPAARQALSLVTASGPAARSVTLPEGVRVAGIEWTAAGSPVVRLRDPPSKGEKWAALDPRTAALRPLPAAPALYAAPPARAAAGTLRLKRTTLAAREGETSQSVGLLWLESAARTENPRALVCADSPGGQLLPRGDGVLYQSQGALWVMPLLRLTPEEYHTFTERLTSSTTRVAAIIARKQVSAAFLKYAAEHSGTLPTGDLYEELGRYVPDTGVLAGFNYTHAGGRLADLPNAAEAELGYLEASGGRAVLYADGHVVWQK